MKLKWWPIWNCVILIALLAYTYWITDENYKGGGGYGFGFFILGYSLVCFALSSHRFRYLFNARIAILSIVNCLLSLFFVFTILLIALAPISMLLVARCAVEARWLEVIETEEVATCSE
jgi:hypothetical protein